MNLRYDGFDAESLQEFLRVPRVVLYESTGSTNDAARQLADQQAPSFTIVLTERQTHGRGRGGKSWLSTPGRSLICSIVFQTSLHPNAAPGAVPVRIGNAVAKAIEATSGLNARLKWPNDVVFQGHGKVAGILCESAMRQDGLARIVAGIGVNVGKVSEEHVSINELSEVPVARTALLKNIVDQIRPYEHALLAPLTDEEIAQIESRDVLINQQVESDDGARGIARSVLPDGSLEIETPDGVKALHNATIRLAHTGGYPGAQK
jgi:BirA family transcriptional regulator, biotin operon repressor / biotin---[acetyl-CoA-carboxylase] ligase